MSRKMELVRILGQGNYRRISRAAGLTPQHVSRVLRGKKGVSFQTASRIADASEVSLDDLRNYIESTTGRKLIRGSAR